MFESRFSTAWEVEFQALRHRADAGLRRGDRGLYVTITCHVILSVINPLFGLLMGRLNGHYIAQALKSRQERSIAEEAALKEARHVSQSPTPNSKGNFEEAFQGHRTR